MQRAEAYIFQTDKNPHERRHPLSSISIQRKRSRCEHIEFTCSRLLCDSCICFSACRLLHQGTNARVFFHFISSLEQAASSLTMGFSFERSTIGVSFTSFPKPKLKSGRRP